MQTPNRTPEEKRRILKEEYGVKGKDGKPCTRITIVAPEMLHATDVPTHEWQVRYGTVSRQQRWQDACAVVTWAEPVAARVLFHPAFTAATLVAVVLVFAFAALG